MIDISEALYQEMLEDDRVNPGWDYPLRLDSARSVVALGYATAEVAAEMYGVDLVDLADQAHERVDQDGKGVESRPIGTRRK